MRATCLRCDWEGSTDRDDCPRCGAPLYRSEPRAERPPISAEALGPGPAPTASPGAPILPGRAVSGASRAPEASPTEPSPAGPLRTRSPWRVLAGLASVATVLALVWALLPGTHPSERSALGGSAPTSPRPTPTGSTGEVPPVGMLLYAADPNGRGRQTLWSLDLSGGGASRGPRIPPAVTLTDASLAAPGWVGVTARGRDGARRALVLTGTGHGVRPRALGSGELVAWAPRGDVVALARGEAASPGRCAGAVIRLVHVTTGARERELEPPILCGDLLALGRDITTTYFTTRSSTGVGTYAVGIGVAHAVLLDFELQGVSPTADFLVLPEDELGRRLPGMGTRLFWPGTGGPLAYGRAGKPLLVERVLAWSPDGSRAAVIGRTRTLRGVFLLDTTAGEDVRRPGTYVVVAGRSTAATFARDGTLYVLVDGLLLRYRDGEKEVVPLPSGAPRPVGPIMWLP